MTNGTVRQLCILQNLTFSAKLKKAVVGLDENVLSRRFFKFKKGDVVKLINVDLLVFKGIPGQDFCFLSGNQYLDKHPGSCHTRHPRSSLPKMSKRTKPLQ